MQVFPFEWAWYLCRCEQETGDGVRFIRSVCDGDPLSRWPRQEQRVEEFIKKNMLGLSVLISSIFMESVEVDFTRSVCL